jgi:hypothetical protein
MAARIGTLGGLVRRQLMAEYCDLLTHGSPFNEEMQLRVQEIHGILLDPHAFRDRMILVNGVMLAPDSEVHVERRL